MRVFKTSYENNNAGDKFMGFYSDADMDTMITLVSIDQKCSRSELLRKITSDYLDAKQLNKEKMIRSVAIEARDMFRANHKRPADVVGSANDFVVHLRRDLLGRNISEAITERIINRFYELEK
jgi:hypothetical protein